jgi:hypothetical protein
MSQMNGDIILNTISTQRRKVLQEAIHPKIDINHPHVVSFISKFIDCELSYKKLVMYYKNDKGNDLKSTVGLKININDLRNACKHFGVDIESINYRLIFGSEKKSGEKSLKNIRDEILHSKSVKSIEYVIENNEEVLNIMNGWIDLIDNVSRGNK